MCVHAGLLWYGHSVHTMLQLKLLSSASVSYLFAQVMSQIFCHWHMWLLSETIEPPTSPEVELNFIGDTPIVTGNDVTVQLSVSPSLPLRCEMITRDAETEMPVIIDTINCESVGKCWQ